ncbi:MAG: hypothetical protein K2X94_03800 [Amoebophilaceae bacterium]|nr:hypothetical protein [Amoebophilaceae bacterium]
MNKLKELFTKNLEFININLREHDYTTGLLKLYIFADFAKNKSLLQAFEDSRVILITEISNMKQLDVLLNTLDLTIEDLTNYV